MLSASLFLFALTLHAASVVERPRVTLTAYEGAVYLGSTPATRVPQTLPDGILVVTSHGRAELRLAGNQFFRLGEQSAARVVSGDVQLASGSAIRSAPAGSVLLTASGLPDRLLSLWAGERQSLLRNPWGAAIAEQPLLIPRGTLPIELPAYLGWTPLFPWRPNLGAAFNGAVSSYIWPNMILYPGYPFTPGPEYRASPRDGMPPVQFHPIPLLVPPPQYGPYFPHRR